MTTTKTYTWEEEEEKLDLLMHEFPYYYEDCPLEKQARLLDRCLILIQDLHEIPEEERADLLNLLDMIEGFVKDLYRLHRAAKGEGFYLSEVSQTLVSNPYCREEKTEDEKAALRGHLFNHKIRHLSYEEVFNIYPFVNKIFEEYSILEWLDFIAEWKAEIAKESRFLNQGELMWPIRNYFTFHKVIEIYYIINRCHYGSHPNTPVEHYWNDNSVVFSDPACVINPFEYLDTLLFDSTLCQIKEEIKSLFDHTKENKQGQASGKLVLNVGYLKALMETAYLITRCAYIPEEWLQPEKWFRPTDYLRPQIEPITCEFLSKKEQKKPYKAIKKHLWYLDATTDTLDDLLYKALDSQKREEDRFNYFTKMNKIVEAVYLIYYDLLSREKIETEG